MLWGPWYFEVRALGALVVIVGDLRAFVLVDALGAMMLLGFRCLWGLILYLWTSILKVLKNMDFNLKRFLAIYGIFILISEILMSSNHSLYYVLCIAIGS